ncbi:MAG: carboxylating nicotinate-nucleotide diphosphorylase [Pseudomonadota bacterium]
MVQHSELDDATAEDLLRLVEAALAEDVGSGDRTAALVSPDASATASIITRETIILAGRPWVDSLFARLDPEICLEWLFDDGETLASGEVLCRLTGPARSLLTGERTALNILQTLSATATTAGAYVEAVRGTGCRILDTRKTIPGLRRAQKYAVRCGGAENHRTGLFDAILIKENHILSAGSISAAIAGARRHNPGILIEIEVESLAELEEALDGSPDRILLDNFSQDALAAAVNANRARPADQRAELEASGNVSLLDVRETAQTGVDFISVGALTKHIRAIDLSMRVDS